jgi:hypothetical protein
MTSIQPGTWRFGSGVIQALLALVVLSSCGRRVSTNVASQDIGFGGEPWVAVENGSPGVQLDWKRPLLYAANGVLWWSLGHDRTRLVNLATGRQDNIVPLDFRAMGGGEGFATKWVDLPQGHATEIVAIDLVTGRRREVALISGHQDDDSDTLRSPLALDATYVYFIRLPGLFRARRDGGGRPEFLASQPLPQTRVLAVEGGYAYWSQVSYGEEPTEILRRRLDVESAPQRLAYASSERFNIADGCLYFVVDGAIWSVRLDGSDRTRHADVGPAGASHILVDHGYLYWTNDREIRRSRLSSHPSQSSEVIVSEDSYGGQSNLATDGHYLCWYDLRRDRIFCLGRDARPQAPRPRRVTKSVPYERPAPVLKKAYKVFVGETWACAGVGGNFNGGAWQCWEQPSIAGAAATALPAQWMVSLLPASAADRVCAVRRDRIHCWPGPDFVHQPPDGLPREMLNQAEGRGALFLGGTFTCGRYLETDDHKRPAWTCEGDNRFHQFAGFQAVARIDSPALGIWHACGVTQDHNLNCWGRGDGGQLGYRPSEYCRLDGQAIACSSKGHDVPFDIPFGGRLLAGDMFTCVVSYKGLTCFGASRDGWFGEASDCPEGLRKQWPTTAGVVAAPRAACSAKPTTVRGFEGIAVNRDWERTFPISLGPRGACAVIDNQVHCVGAIPTPSTQVSSVAVNAGNRANACGIADGKVVCWGEGYSSSDNPSTVVAVELYPPQLPDAAVVDFPASSGKSWPVSYAIHHACTLPVQGIPKCPAGTTGEPWSKLVADAPRLVGQTISVRDRLMIGTWTTCSPPRRGIICDREFSTGGSFVLGEGDQPLSLLGHGYCVGDNSRLCCSMPAAGQTVVVTGTLGRTNTWFLDGAVCEIDEATSSVQAEAR